MNLVRLIPTFCGLFLMAGLLLEPAFAFGPFPRGGGGRPPREAMRPPPRAEPRPAPAFQRPPEPQERPVEAPCFQEPARPATAVSPNDAARRAQQVTGGGRVLSVDPNGPGYRVKVLKEGEVRIINVPGG